MHTLVVNFNLKDMTDDEFRQFCDEVAPTFAAVPGLVQKVWLADEATNTYGGVYTFKDRAAFEAYTRSELFQSVASNANFVAITARDYGVLDGPTRVTGGLGAVAV
ncbi:MAG: YdhR family protein [Dehalococcoidia bacterium]